MLASWNGADAGTVPNCTDRTLQKHDMLPYLLICMFAVARRHRSNMAKFTTVVLCLAVVLAAASYTAGEHPRTLLTHVASVDSRAVVVHACGCNHRVLQQQVTAAAAAGAGSMRIPCMNTAARGSCRISFLYFASSRSYSVAAHHTLLAVLGSRAVQLPAEQPSICLLS